MARTTQWAKLILTPEGHEWLEELSHSRKVPLCEVQRAKILLHYAAEVPIAEMYR